MSTRFASNAFSEEFSDRPHKVETLLGTGFQWPQRETPNRVSLKTHWENHGIEINDKESWRKKHGKRNHREGIIERGGSWVIWETFGSHLGSISEPFGSHLGDIWEDVGWRGIWGAFGGQISENRCQSATECKSCISFSILRCVFEGQITKYCKLQ